MIVPFNLGVHIPIPRVRLEIDMNDRKSRVTLQ